MASTFLNFMLRGLNLLTSTLYIPHIMRIILLFFVLFLSLINNVNGQEQPPKREFRGVWIATVGNIDWPSQKGLSSYQQQQEFIQYLNLFQSLGFNAVIVQIRDAADAFYPSPYEPWSAYLSGKQGQPPFPKYDPLAFMIHETHKRNMEFHAWFNPFRALVNSRVNPNPPDHVTRVHPDWIINYGGKSYFDPGNPNARNYILRVIMDVVKRYDIDAVHIDDYFYPYHVQGETFHDNSSYAKYGNELDKDDWRRNNINLFISQLNNQIKNEKPWVQFGVSPFGIWRNESKDPEGSETHGSSCYDDLYSDVLLWMKKGWVDYVAPQLYWPCSSKNASYSVLLPWWIQHKQRDRIYIGLGLYRLPDAGRKSPWYGTSEILKQIRMARAAHADGLVFYSASSFKKVGKAFADSLKDHYFSTIAFPPTMPWIDHSAPPAPKLYATITADGAMLLQWIDQEKEEDGEPLKFAIYRFKNSAPINLSNPKNIVAITQGDEYKDLDYTPDRHFKYVVTALDRLWNESEPSNVVKGD